MRDLAEFRGSPVVLLFHSAQWDPAEREVVETYNRLIARLPASVSAGARLVRVAGESAWRDLTFDDDALALPVVAGDATLARKFGVGNHAAVVVLDADGEVRWRHAGNDVVSTTDLARAVTAAAAPSCGATGSFSRRQFVATVFGVACAIAVAPRLSYAERVASAAAGLADDAVGSHANSHAQCQRTRRRSRRSSRVSRCSMRCASTRASPEQEGLRSRTVRRLHGPHRRTPHAVVPHASP